MNKGGVDRNLRMIIFGNSKGNNMHFRYDALDEPDLLAAVDKWGFFYKSQTKRIKMATLPWPDTCKYLILWWCRRGDSNSHGESPTRP